MAQQGKGPTKARDKNQTLAMCLSNLADKVGGVGVFSVLRAEGAALAALQQQPDQLIQIAYIEHGPLIGNGGEEGQLFRHGFQSAVVSLAALAIDHRRA